MKSAGRWLVAASPRWRWGWCPGCGERAQVVVYKQGKYQGKPDTKPWDNAPGGVALHHLEMDQGRQGELGNRAQARAQGQNEYERIEGRRRA